METAETAKLDLMELYDMRAVGSAEDENETRRGDGAEATVSVQYHGERHGAGQIQERAD